MIRNQTVDHPVTETGARVAEAEVKPPAAQSQATPGIHWPPPPFCTAVGKSPAPAGGRCSVEMIDGLVIEGDLREFETGADASGLRLETPDGMHCVRFTRVRLVKLTTPVSYVADLKALTALGAGQSENGSARSFVAALKDGTKIRGKTLGFIKESIGFFLYLVERDLTSVVKCFIPAARVLNLQVGPPLGETLIQQRSVSAVTVAGALNKQAKLRQERIGNYLAERAVISSEQLLTALSEQDKRPEARLGDILVEAGMITPAQLRDALAIQANHRERRIGDILIDIGAASPRLIQVALSDKLGIPYVNVREFPIAPGVLEVLDMGFAIRHQVLPLVRTSELLIVAVENPLASDFLQDLRFQTSMEIAPVIADTRELKARISKEYSGLESRGGYNKAASGPAVPLGAKDAVQSTPRAATAQARVADLTSQLARESQKSQRPVKDVAIDSRVSENTMVRLVNKIIVEAHAQGASDIHIESNAGSAFTRIRFRKDGDLEDYLELPQEYSSSLVSRIKVMADLDIAEHRHPQDGKIDFARHGPLAIELRVAVIPTAGNLEDVVMRILGGATTLLLGEIGFSDLDLKSLQKMISRSFGLILVCGPTGSGKTTTLHSLLHDINRPDLKIWTAEDPIEITQPGLRQVQVHPKIDWTFAAAMRAFLRADPDVIMVGEMRDAETTKIAIEASLTGHLVLSTLHTNSAAESIVRLLDLGMDPFNFADALIGIVSQRLARKLCPSCKQVHVASDEEIADLVDEYCSETNLLPATVLASWKTRFFTNGNLLLHEASGCDACRDGYKGRVVVYELLTASPEIKHLVRGKAAVTEMMSVALQQGMISLRQHAIEKLLQGLLDVATARAVSS